MVDPGWLAVYGREAQDEDANLVPTVKNEKVKTGKARPADLITKPSACYSEAALLSVMKGAGRLVDDDALHEVMASRGLGTLATRVVIIEDLLTERYLVREGRGPIPTTKAFQLMTLLRGLGMGEPAQTELTGGWEHEFSPIEHDQLERDELMRRITQMMRQIVKRAREHDSDTIPGDHATSSTPCP